MFKLPFLIILVWLLPVPGVLAQGQTDPTGRPRRTQVAEESARPARSAAANEEAKRLYKLGVKYGNAHLFKQAANAFEEAVKLNPDYAEAYLSLGHAYYDLEQWPQAIDSLERGLALKPSHKDSQERLAHARLMLRRAQASREKKSPEGNGDGEQANGSAVGIPARAAQTATTGASCTATTAPARTDPRGPAGLPVRLNNSTEIPVIRLPMAAAHADGRADVALPENRRTA